jgi:hypothetical protein
MSCPPVIAVEKDRTFYRIKRGMKNAPFECFGKVRDAIKRGYVESTDVEASSFTGWWRVAVKPKENSCPGESLPSAPVNLFMQMLETGGAVFGEVCPTTLRYVGKRLRGGLTMVGTKMIDSDLLCSTGQAEITYTIDFSSFTGAKAHNASFHIVKRCLKTPATCSISYQGEAFRETIHEFFPQVPNDVNNFAGTCSFTLSKCADCH